jgi:heme exporter protein CcmD
MNDPHTGFIVAAYAIAALAIVGMIAALMIERRKLDAALARFPRRDSGDDAS